MMKKRFLAVLVTGLFLLIMTGLAQATLTTIGTATYDGSDYNLIWDDNNNGNSIVWLDYTNLEANWTAQNDWAAGLDSSLSYNINPVYTVAWDDAAWRLPDTVDGVWQYGYDGTTTAGYSITTSEMGHLYYTELGNLGYYDTSGNVPQSGWGLNNTGDFDNLTEDWYWSGTEYAGDTSLAWTFNMHKGTQNYSKKYFYDCGLAVRSGEVSAAPVPEPGTMLLFSTGLAGLAVLRRKRKGSCV